METWLNAVATPVFVLSADRHVVFFNSGCEELTGWSADDVVGQVCDYGGDGDAGSLAAITGSLCPPPEVFAGREMNVPAYFAGNNGPPLARLLRFIPLKDAGNRVESILGAITPMEQTPRRTHGSSAQQLHAELAALRISLRQRYGLKGFVASSLAMQRVSRQIELARGCRLPLFLCGEKGTGKEHVARLVHYESEGRTRSFVPLDCRQLSSRQLKQAFNRLFSPEPDERPAVPAFEAGTLYLAHVDQLPRDLQAELLHALAANDREGAARLRLISSSERSLDRAADDDRFRSDLLYLLTPLTIFLPPLRNRPDDLQPLAQHFLEELNRGSEKQVGGFEEAVWEQFREYNWPANLDELAAVVEEARTAATGHLVRVADLPFRFRTGLDAQGVGPSLAPKPTPLEPLLARIEKEQIELALAQARHNKSKAADLLGLTRARLYRRMEQLGIEDTGADSGE